MIKTEYEITINPNTHGDLSAALTNRAAFTIALVTDLHEHEPSEVLQILRDAKPDVIAVAGDTLERHEHGENLDKGDRSMLSRLICTGIHLADKLAGVRRQKRDVKVENSYRFLQEAGKTAPVVMSLGNHELYLTDEDRTVISVAGVKLLDNDAVEINGILFGGLTSKQITGEMDAKFLSDFSAYPGYKILLCHHPEYYPGVKRVRPLVLQTGAEQYVILGAGLDTFAFREQEFLKRYEVFELDHPLTQKDKKERIRRAGWALPDKLHFVPIDFTKDELGEKLIESGFKPEKKSFFSWLGVCMYLEQNAIEKVLQNLSTLAADGSDLIFDYADDGLFQAEERRVQNMLAMAKAGGEEMKSCFDQMSLELMLSSYHFLTYEHLSRREIQNRFFSERNDWLSAFEHINYVHAVLKK